MVRRSSRGGWICSRSGGRCGKVDARPLWWRHNSPVPAPRRDPGGLCRSRRHSSPGSAPAARWGAFCRSDRRESVGACRPEEGGGHARPAGQRRPRRPTPASPVTPVTPVTPVPPVPPVRCYAANAFSSRSASSAYDSPKMSSPPLHQQPWWRAFRTWEPRKPSGGRGEAYASDPVSIVRPSDTY